MDAYVNLVKKLSLLSVLSVSITESPIISGSIWADTRISLWSRMIELVLKRYDSLNLKRFIGTTNESLFVGWVHEQLIDYSAKDMWTTTSYLQTAEVSKGLHWYEINPKTSDVGYLFYNLSRDRVLYIIQRLDFNTVYFPCSFSIYVEKDIRDLVEESFKREQKNEQQKKSSNNRVR
jgi:hypothetical protein